MNKSTVEGLEVKSLTNDFVEAEMKFLVGGFFGGVAAGVVLTRLYFAVALAELEKLRAGVEKLPEALRAKVKAGFVELDQRL